MEPAILLTVNFKYYLKKPLVKIFLPHLSAIINILAQ